MKCKLKLARNRPY